MKILFLGLAPSADLLKKLSYHQFICETDATKAYADTWDIVFIKFEEKKTEFARQLKLATTPSTYVSVVIPSSQMANPDSAQFLLDFEQKNEVLVEEMFEPLFWFSMQNALQFFNTHKAHTEIETLKKQIATATQELENNLALAKAIQRSLLPSPPKLSIPDVQINFKFIPSAGRGGDYFDVFEYGDKKRFGFLLSESDSHTITANLLSVLLKVKMHEFKDRFISPEAFMNFLNEEFKGQIPDMTPLNFFFSTFERTSLQLKFVNGGEYSPILLREHKAKTLPSKFQDKLGFNSKDYFHESLSLKPGDKILIYSSGLITFFKPKELCEFFETLESLNSAELISEIHLALREKGADSSERDITLIYLEISPKAMFAAK